MGEFITNQKEKNQEVVLHTDIDKSYITSYLEWEIPMSCVSKR